MKKPFFTLAIAALMVTSCNKDNSTQPSSSTNTLTTTNSTISNDDVTQVVTNAVSGSTAGFATQSETTAQMTTAASIPCGSSKDTTISGSAQGLIISYNYDLTFTRTPVCSGGTETQLNTTFSGTWGYSVVVMSSQDTVNMQSSVTGLAASSASYVLNETYTLKGTQQSGILMQHAFNSTLTITSDNITVSKSTNKIVSGTADVQFTGTDAKGNAVNQTATITFLGNNQATLVVNNGNPQTISW